MEATGQGRDRFAGLPSEVLHSIYLSIPKSCSTSGADFGPEVWHRDSVVMQLSSRWFWLVTSSRYRVVKVEFDNVLRLVESMRRLPRLAALVDSLVVRFQSQASDIRSAWLWDRNNMERPLPRPIPPAHDRVFMDRRKIYKIAFWESSDDCRDMESEPCGECALCEARGQPGWPYQSEHYEDDVLVNEYIPQTDGDEDELILRHGPTGRGPIEGIAGWDDWFRLFVQVATLCRPRAVVWATPLAEMPEKVVAELAGLKCVRALLLGNSAYPQVHYGVLLAEAEVVRIGSGYDDPQYPRHSVSEDWQPLPAEPWTVGQVPGGAPLALIDDAPAGSCGHTLFVLLRSTSSERLRHLTINDEWPWRTSWIYQSPGLLPLLLAVPSFQSPVPSTNEVQLVLYEAFVALREALSALAPPLMPQTLREILKTTPACSPISQPVSDAAEAICERFNCRPEPQQVWPAHLEELLQAEFELPR